MENKIYVDTNVFIDLLDATRPLANSSFTAIKKLIDGGTMLYINSDTVTNAFYILKKTKKYEAGKLLELLKKIVQLFVVVPIENDEVMLALELCIDNSTSNQDYEDALQYICAKKVQAHTIVTNDFRFVSEDITIRNPKEI